MIVAENDVGAFLCVTPRERVADSTAACNQNDLPFKPFHNASLIFICPYRPSRIAFAEHHSRWLRRQGSWYYNLLVELDFEERYIKSMELLIPRGAPIVKSAS
jgi:hypothetical protein